VFINVVVLCSTHLTLLKQLQLYSYFCPMLETNRLPLFLKYKQNMPNRGKYDFKGDFHKKPNLTLLKQLQLYSYFCPMLETNRLPLFLKYKQKYVDPR